MPDYGLTLPEHDLTAAEFKELARRLGRAAYVPLFLKFYERIVTNEASIEEQRKALADIARITGVEEDRKVDPNANLPVFNIIFGASGTPTLAAEVVQLPVEELPVVPREALPQDMTPEQAATILADADKLFSQFPLPEPEDAQSQARSSTYGALQDLAEAVAAAGGADQPAQPAGSGAPDTEDVQRPAEQGGERLHEVPPVPQALHGQGDSLEDALKTLDSALDGF